MKNEMWHQINRLIEKYEVQDDQIAIDLVNILKGHRENLGVDTPTDPISYEQLLSYHLAFPPFFPNQKPFVSDDDFFVRTHEMYANPDLDNIDNIIQRRREWFEEEMIKKRDRFINVKYYDATGWTMLPSEGLDSLTPYATGTTYSINFSKTSGNFAGSGRQNYVGALFQGYVYASEIVQRICVNSDDGSKLYIDDVLKINNDGLHVERRRCAGITTGLHKVDLEYFESGGKAVLVLEWGSDAHGIRAIPPRAWASVSDKALSMPKVNHGYHHFLIFAIDLIFTYYFLLLCGSFTDQ